MASPYEPLPGTAVPPPPAPDQPQVSLQDFHRPIPGQVDWRRAWPGALVAGILANFASLILPRPPFMFLCMLAGGALAVTLYRRRTRVDHLRPGQGFRIGALAGFFGFLFIAFMSAVAFISSAGRAEMSTRMQQAMQQALQQAGSGGVDPQAQQQMQNLIASLNTPEGLATVLGIGMLLVLVFFVLLAGGGGALSAKIFGHDSR
ncbi:MAG TPA: hypothetical protein VF786_01025 [Terriglobales bacterium]